MAEKDYRRLYESVCERTHIYGSKYKNEIDLIDKIISIYDITKKKKEDRILPFEKSILIYYILFGFNTEAKETVMKDLGKNQNQINSTNSNLRKKGYLFKDHRNKTKGYVLKDLKEMADIFRNDPNKIFALKFIK